MDTELLLIIVMVAFALITIVAVCIWFSGSFLKKEKKVVVIKGDLVKEDINIKHEEKSPDPKPAWRTADYDLPDAHIILSFGKINSKWKCDKCGTENIQGNKQCMVCGAERRE